MLLKKQRLKEMENSRVQNQNWKDEIAKQILEKQLFKQNQKRKNEQLSRIEQQKIKKYQQQITDRIEEGNYSRGKRDRTKIEKSEYQGQEQIKRNKIISSNSVYLKHKDERIKTNPTVKKLSFADNQQEIPLFSFAEIDNPEMVSNNKINKVRRLDTQTNDDEIIVLSFPEEARKKERKSTSKKRQQTVNSRRNTEGSNVFEIDALEQQNKKLKQELTKSNTIIENLMKMIKVQSKSQEMYRQAESILEGNEIGETEYIRFQQNSFNQFSPNKMLFPSLDFKTNSLIKDFNIGAAKKATSLNSIDVTREQE